MIKISDRPEITKLKLSTVWGYKESTTHTHVHTHINEHTPRTEHTGKIYLNAKFSNKIFDGSGLRVTWKKCSPQNLNISVLVNACVCVGECV